MAARPQLRVVPGSKPSEPAQAGSRGNSTSGEMSAVDPADLDQVFRRFAPYVARIASRILGRSDELDDLVQDVFLDAHRGLVALRDNNAIRHWLATVTVRKARRRLTRRRWVHWIGLDPAIDPTFSDPTTSSRDHALVLAVYRILDDVSPDERIAWVMHRVEGEALENIAQVCGCSRATAHRLVTRAQAALLKGLNHVGTD
jgi:RNA polymerase sigma-70 factor (ECF subfamily)